MAKTYSSQKSIVKGLLLSADISEPVVESPEKGAYDIRFRFDNFAGNSGKDFFEWSQERNGNTKLSIVVNRKTYQELERRFPTMGDNALLRLYGPATTEGMSRSDYLDMVEYSLGPEARRDLPKGEAVISVQVPGKVISQTGRYEEEQQYGGIPFASARLGSTSPGKTL